MSPLRDKSLKIQQCDRSIRSIIDPPGPSQIGDHYFHAWCPYVRSKHRKHTRALEQTNYGLRGSLNSQNFSTFLFAINQN